MFSLIVHLQIWGAEVTLSFASILAIVCLALTAWYLVYKYKRVKALLEVTQMMAQVAAENVAREERERIERLAAENQVAEELRVQRLDELLLLQGRLNDLRWSLCGTDSWSEFLKQQACSQGGEVYQSPKPEESLRDVYVEVITLQEVIAQVGSDLADRLTWDLNIGWYQQRLESLSHRYFQWQEQKRARAELERLMRRLDELVNTLCCHHDTRERDICMLTGWLSLMDTYIKKIKDYQDLCDAAIVLQWMMARRMQDPVSGTGRPDIQSFEEWVENLEWWHRAFDGRWNLFGGYARTLVEEAGLGAWQLVVEFTPDTSRKLLLEYLEESYVKYQAGCAQARQLLLQEGPCAQERAVKDLKVAMVHWSCIQAIQLILHEQTNQEAERSSSRMADHRASFQQELWYVCTNMLLELDECIIHASVQSPSSNFIL